MPIEIRELIIKATVSDNSSEDSKAQGAGSNDKADLIAECVEQVMEILKDKKER